MSLSRIKLPQALVVVALIAAVTLVLIFGPDVELRGWVLRIVVGVLSGAGLLGAGAMGSFVRPKEPPIARGVRRDRDPIAFEPEQESEEP